MGTDSEARLNKWVEFVKPHKEYQKWLDFKGEPDSSVSQVSGQPISLKGVNVYSCAITDSPLPFDTHYFDVVSLFDVSRGVGDLRALMDEIDRILKPQGLLIINVSKYPPSQWVPEILKSGYYLRCHFEAERKAEVLGVRDSALREDKALESITSRIALDAFGEGDKLVRIHRSLDQKLFVSLLNKWSVIEASNDKLVGQLEDGAALYLLNTTGESLVIDFDFVLADEWLDFDLSTTIDGNEYAYTKLANTKSKHFGLRGVWLPIGGHIIWFNLHSFGAEDPALRVEKVELSRHVPKESEGKLIRFEDPKIEKLYELPVDQFQRYKVLEELAGILKKSRGLKKISVLDVGGYPGLISDFIPSEKTIIVDLVPCDKPNYVQVDGLSLPFEDESFDVVTSVDVLEHVEPKQRLTFLKELTRVSREAVIVVAPFADKVKEMAEEILYSYVRDVQGLDFSFLREHLDYGLPDHKLVEQFFDSTGLPYTSFPNGYFYNWLLIMFIRQYLMAIPGGQELQRLINKFYNLNFSSQDYRCPAYRTVFVLSKTSEDFVRRIDERYRQIKVDNDREIASKLQLFGTFLQLYKIGEEKMEEGKRRREMVHLAERLSTCRKEIKDLQNRVTERDRIIADLQDWLDQIHSRLSYRIYRRLKDILKRS